MKQIPILYGTAMVIAQLAGLKTQTRRVVKDQPTSPYAVPAQLGHGLRSDGIRHSGLNDQVLWHWVVEDQPCGVFLCPYGRPGDLHWVRETWRRVDISECGCSDICSCISHPYSYYASSVDDEAKWKPSIFMPRDAARLFNRVTAVRIERVQAISREDAIAEGFKAISKDNGKTIKYGIPDLDGLPGTDNHGWPWAEWCFNPVQAYRKLWNSINLAPKPIMKKGAITGYVAYPWSEADFDYAYPDIRASRMYKGQPITIYANPFVWVTSFNRDEQGGLV